MSRQLFIITTADVDALLQGLTLTPELREHIYEQVERMDASLTFEQIQDIIDFTLYDHKENHHV